MVFGSAQLAVDRVESLDVYRHRVLLGERSHSDDPIILDFPRSTCSTSKEPRSQRGAKSKVLGLYSVTSICGCRVIVFSIV